MSVRSYKTKAGTRWEYAIDLPRGLDGKRRQRRVAGFATKADAVAAEMAERVDRRRGVWADPSTATVAEWLEEWLAETEPRVVPGTLRDYRAIGRAHLLPLLGPVRLSDLTPARVEAALRQLGRDRTPATVNRALAVLRMALARAVVLGVLPRNPTDHVLRRPASAARAARPAWTAAQARAFLAAADAAGDPMRALWRYLLDTGCRKGEALALAWPDLDLDAGTARVWRTVRKDAAGREVVGPRTKTGRERVLTLAPATVAALRAHRAGQLARKVRLRPVWQETGLVFDNGRGGMMPTATLDDRLARAQRGLGLPRLAPHGLRHTSATLAVLAGVPLPVVQRRLGHASITMTVDIYAHVGLADDRLASGALGAILTPEPPECEGIGEGKA